MDTSLSCEEDTEKTVQYSMCGTVCNCTCNCVCRVGTHLVSYTMWEQLIDSQDQPELDLQGGQYTKEPSTTPPTHTHLFFVLLQAHMLVSPFELRKAILILISLYSHSCDFWLSRVNDLIHNNVVIQYTLHIVFILLGTFFCIYTNCVLNIYSRPWHTFKDISSVGSHTYEVSLFFWIPLRFVRWCTSCFQFILWCTAPAVLYCMWAEALKLWCKL